MGEDVRRPLRGAGLSSLCLQEKKGLPSIPSQPLCLHVWHSLIGHTGPPPSFTVLVSAVSDAVEAILGQFSASRTVVQKVSQCWSGKENS